MSNEEFIECHRHEISNCIKEIEKHEKLIEKSNNYILSCRKEIKLRYDFINDLRIN